MEHLALEKEVLEFITGKQHVSFVELKKFLCKKIPVEGTFCVEAFPNVILWRGMSREFEGLILEMFQKGLIFPHPCTRMVYWCDGELLVLPLAARSPEGGYKQPHWLPVTFCTYPPNEKTGGSV